MRSSIWRGISAGLCFAALAAAIACGDSSNGNSAGSNPTAPSAPTLNLAGSWSGTLRPINSSRPMGFVWTASQSGPTATGRATIRVTEEDGRVAEFNGTLTAAISGAQAALTLTLPAGSFPEAPSCSISSTGTSTPSAQAISAQMTTTFSTACIGVVSEGPTEVDELRLTKQ